MGLLLTHVVVFCWSQDSLDEEQKVTLEVARLIREDYLNQNAFSPHDYTCPPSKTLGMLRTSHLTHHSPHHTSTARYDVDTLFQAL